MSSNPIIFMAFPDLASPAIRSSPMRPTYNMGSLNELGSEGEKEIGAGSYGEWCDASAEGAPQRICFILI